MASMAHLKTKKKHNPQRSYSQKGRIGHSYPDTFIFTNKVGTGEDLYGSASPLDFACPCIILFKY